MPSARRSSKPATPTVEAPAATRPPTYATFVDRPDTAKRFLALKESRDAPLEMVHEALVDAMDPKHPDRLPGGPWTGRPDAPALAIRILSERVASGLIARKSEAIDGSSNAIPVPIAAAWRDADPALAEAWWSSELGACPDWTAPIGPKSCAPMPTAGALARLGPMDRLRLAGGIQGADRVEPPGSAPHHDLMASLMGAADRTGSADPCTLLLRGDIDAAEAMLRPGSDEQTRFDIVAIRRILRSRRPAGVDDTAIGTAKAALVVFGGWYQNDDPTEVSPHLRRLADDARLSMDARIHAAALLIRGPESGRRMAADPSDAARLVSLCDAADPSDWTRMGDDHIRSILRQPTTEATAAAIAADGADGGPGLGSRVFTHDPPDVLVGPSPRAIAAIGAALGGRSDMRETTWFHAAAIAATIGGDRAERAALCRTAVDMMDAGKIGADGATGTAGRTWIRAMGAALEAGRDRPSEADIAAAVRADIAAIVDHMTCLRPGGKGHEPMGLCVDIRAALADPMTEPGAMLRLLDGRDDGRGFHIASYTSARGYRKVLGHDADDLAVRRPMRDGDAVARIDAVAAGLGPAHAVGSKAIRAALRELPPWFGEEAADIVGHGMPPMMAMMGPFMMGPGRRHRDRDDGRGSREPGDVVHGPRRGRGAGPDADQTTAFVLQAAVDLAIHGRRPRDMAGLERMGAIAGAAAEIAGRLAKPKPPASAGPSAEPWTGTGRSIGVASTPPPGA